MSVVALQGCQRGRTGFYRKPNLAEIEQKAGVDTALKVPSQYVSVEHIPCCTVAHHGPDLRLGAEQTLGDKSLDALSQHGA